MKTPCVQICVVDPATGWCVGCFRTMSEIGSWSRYSHAERDVVLRRLRERRKAFADRAARTEPAQ